MKKFTSLAISLTTTLMAVAYAEADPATSPANSLSEAPITQEQALNPITGQTPTQADAAQPGNTPQREALAPSNNPSGLLEKQPLEKQTMDNGAPITPKGFPVAEKAPIQEGEDTAATQALSQPPVQKEAAINTSNPAPKRLPNKLFKQTGAKPEPNQAKNPNAGATHEAH